MEEDSKLAEEGEDGDDEDDEDDEDSTLFGGQISCAFFHPAWQFSGLDADDPVNWERRSPLPCVSLLRKSDVKQHVEDGLKRGVSISQQIHEENEKTLRRIGSEVMCQSSAAWASSLGGEDQ